MNDTQKEMAAGAGIRNKKRNKVGNDDDLKGNFCL